MCTSVIAQFQSQVETCKEGEVTGDCYCVFTISTSVCFATDVIANSPGFPSSAPCRDGVTLRGFAGTLIENASIIKMYIFLFYIWRGK